VLAADGSLIAVLYRENRVVAPLQDIPEMTRKAVIATEDARFYAHNGVDFKGTPAPPSRTSGPTRSPRAGRR
jgi:membrane carboxypeptidase/penicillin-binding protein